MQRAICYPKKKKTVEHIKAEKERYKRKIKSKRSNHQRCKHGGKKVVHEV